MLLQEIEPLLLRTRKWIWLWRVLKPTEKAIFALMHVISLVDSVLSELVPILLIFIDLLSFLFDSFEYLTMLEFSDVFLIKLIYFWIFEHNWLFKSQI